MTNQNNPNQEQVSLFLNRLEILTEAEKEKVQKNILELLQDSEWKSKMANAWHLAGYSSRDSSRELAWVSARESARNLGGKSPLFPSREAARASGALVVRDLISTEDFEILVAPCRFLLEELGIATPIEGQGSI